MIFHYIPNISCIGSIQTARYLTYYRSRPMSRWTWIQRISLKRWPEIILILAKSVFARDIALDKDYLICTKFRRYWSSIALGLVPNFTSSVHLRRSRSHTVPFKRSSLRKIIPLNGKSRPLAHRVTQNTLTQEKTNDSRDPLTASKTDCRRTGNEDK